MTESRKHHDEYVVEIETNDYGWMDAPVFSYVAEVTLPGHEKQWQRFTLRRKRVTPSQHPHENNGWCFYNTRAREWQGGLENRPAGAIDITEEDALLAILTNTWNGIKAVQHGWMTW